MRAERRDAAAPGRLPSIELGATTYTAQFYVGIDPITVAHLPFTVGHEAAPHEVTAGVPLAGPGEGPTRSGSGSAPVVGMRLRHRLVEDPLLRAEVEQDLPAAVLSTGTQVRRALLGR